MNTVELSSIPNSIPEDLENTMINICRESGIDVEARYIEILRDVANSLSPGIVEVTIKQSHRKMQLYWRIKTGSVVKTLGIYRSLTKFWYLSPFACIINLPHVNVRSPKAMKGTPCCSSRQHCLLKIVRKWKPTYTPSHQWYSWLSFGLGYWKLIFVNIVFAL